MRNAPHYSDLIALAQTAPVRPTIAICPERIRHLSPTTTLELDEPLEGFVGETMEFAKKRVLSFGQAAHGRLRTRTDLRSRASSYGTPPELMPGLQQWGAKTSISISCRLERGWVVLFLAVAGP
jgi:hypothetical protein